MTNTKHTYQAMFLLENGEVREKGFSAVRDWLKGTLEKHSIDVKVLRLYGERKLAYPIGGRVRATYVLGWLEAEGEAVNAAMRDMYLVGPAFRMRFFQEAEIPEAELAFGIEEVNDADLVILDDQPEEVIEEEYVEPEEEKAASKDAADGDKKTEGKADDAKAETTETKEEPAKEAAKEEAK
ncbi:MAG: hypothetical protein HN405_00475 [Planctomycetes bacterium]|jgi:ribosomal protein S6|nr:hypothetical protein [Planctomycetota bacterium]MBT4028859.1 hypothetical protein [Planctomycetota bacterium]MBT4559581.1 hypothetical protein [Planctomycetota bacterium]MBT5100307.1 hypothetical protein [Planctomycetota bacterium]MBT7012867.1 hypothetical protein [Planctomycetota bacterium]